MENKKNLSGLHDHKRQRGSLVTPFNDAIKNATLNSWTKDRLPEYLWLGLILMEYGREVGFETAGRILSDISKINDGLLQPKLSKFFSLPNDQQEIIYEIIAKYADKEVLSPLTILYPRRFYPIFNDFFFVSHKLVEDRIQKITQAIELFSPHQSNEATDLRFLTLCLMLFRGKIAIFKDLEIANVFNEYPYTDHENELMRIYRPAIRSIEGITFDLEDKNNNFSMNFWKDIGMITPCNPKKFEFPLNETNYNEFINDCQKIIEYIFYSNKEKSILEDRFDVIIGSINYAIKIFDEINEKSLSNSILGRHAIRTIIEVYIMLKYLLNHENEHPNIWGEYKLYGVSKYKLVLLKWRENNKLNLNSHVKEPILDLIVNEIMWEEYINIDLKYFDNLGIRDKFIDVDEKEVYDLYYDYDSSFSHGLWGAVRESSFFRCDKQDHLFHSMPDFFNNQSLPDIKSDSYRMIIFLLTFLRNQYEIPDWFCEKYLDTK